MVVTKTRRKNTELDLLNTNGLQRGIGGDQNHREIGKLYMMLHCQHRNDFALQWAAVKFTSMFTNCGRTKSQLDSIHKPLLLDEWRVVADRTDILQLTSLAPYG